MGRRLSGHVAHLLFTLILALGAGVPATGLAATDVFVEIAELGGCGSSTDAQFMNDIVAQSFTEGITRQLDDKTGLPAGTKVIERGLTMTKAADGCSPLLFLVALNGQRLSVHAFFVQTGPARVVTNEIIATGALITSLTTALQNAAQEVVQFGIAGTLTILTRTQNPDGSVNPPQSKCWDFALSAEC